MLVFVFILPLIIALACLAFSQRVPTRWLGVAAAAAALVCAVALLLARLRGELPLALIDRIWIALDQRTLSITLTFDAANWLLALIVFGAGGLSLLMLALAVPLNVRGFGGLFASALLALCAVVAGLANQSALLLPFYWAVAALLIFLALRASGAIGTADAPLLVLLAGLAGALLMLGVALVSPGEAQGLVPAQAALVCWTLVGLLVLGAPPFHAHAQALAEAPAALAGALLAPGLPLLGGYALIRFFAGQAGSMTHGWQLALTVLGLATLLICAAGALGTTRLRQLLAWQFSAQMGLVLLALGQGGVAITIAAPALLANSALAAVACYLAVAILERRAGSDDMTVADLHESLALPGVIFLIGAASALGLPGSWGLWTHRWLLDELARAMPWAVPFVLAGSALLALAFVAPLALFWRRAAAPAEPATPQRGLPLVEVLLVAASAAPLLILGIVPQFAWRGWLVGLQSILAPGVPVVVPMLPDALGQAICAVAALLLIALPLIVRASRKRAAPLGAQPRLVGVIAPSALGESLRGLAWLGMPTEAFNAVWQALLRLSRGLRRGLALFEQRYYLAGLLIAVILVIMLFIQ